MDIFGVMLISEIRDLVMTWHLMLNSINKEKQILNKDWLRFTKLLELPFLANWEPKLEPLMLTSPCHIFPLDSIVRGDAWVSVGGSEEIGKQEPMLHA